MDPPVPQRHRWYRIRRAAVADAAASRWQVGKAAVDLRCAARRPAPRQSCVGRQLDHARPEAHLRAAHDPRRRVDPPRRANHPRARVHHQHADLSRRRRRRGHPTCPPAPRAAGHRQPRAAAITCRPLRRGGSADPARWSGAMTADTTTRRRAARPKYNLTRIVDRPDVAPVAELLALLPTLPTWPKAVNG